jgi:hypothetical protein
MSDRFASLPMQDALLERLPETRRIMLLPCLFRAREPLDLDLLGRAARFLVERSPALRTAVFRDGGQWVQELTDRGPAITPIDIGAARSDDVFPRWRAATEVLDASRGLNVVITPMRTDRIGHYDRFGVVVSHLALDGVSSAAFNRYLIDAYQRLRQGEQPAMLPELCSVKTYAERLNSARRAGRWRDELPRWREMVGAARQSRGLGEQRVEDPLRSTLVRALPADTWKAARAAMTAAGRAPHEGAFGVIVRALQEELGLDGLLVHLFHHGRNGFDGLELRRTFGAIAVTHPLFVRNLPAGRAGVDAFAGQLTAARAEFQDGLGYWAARQDDPEGMKIIDDEVLGRNGVTLNWTSVSWGSFSGGFRVTSHDPRELGSDKDRSPLGIGVVNADGLGVTFEHVPAVLPVSRLEAVWDRCVAGFTALASGE